MIEQDQDSISTTQLARNLSQTIDRLRFERRSLPIAKGRRVVAELTPPREDGLSFQQFTQLRNC